MTLTRRGVVAAALLMGTLVCLVPDEAEPIGGPCPVGSALTRYEDGSGFCANRLGDTVASFPEDTFGWDCATMGNRVCGPARLQHWSEVLLQVQP